jgi:KUP system potassium uptake protein
LEGIFLASDLPQSNPVVSRAALRATTIAALGVVFGDIGTSPLYALRECFHGTHAIALTNANVLGVLSLMIWSLFIVISVKYQIFVLRADNKGEGGILALMALVAPRGSASTKNRMGLITALGLFGAALLYGDGVITPAISVLGAVEGLRIVTPLFEPYLIIIAIAILLGLFFVQSYGTAKIGKYFGSIILCWFLVLAILGIGGIWQHPDILVAFNPKYAFDFLTANSVHGFIVLGSVFLVVTGGEALYADLGHFGRHAIQLGWFIVALPALLLQYLGQGALLLSNPDAAQNPFFFLAPSWALLPLVLLATVAASIASQAVITGAFSLSQQAVQLGFLPRLAVLHTSASERGQIYVPFVNWALLWGTIYLVLEFQSSSNLAAAYGIAVTATMFITTVLIFVVMRRRWNWNLGVATFLSVVFLIVDFSFLGANSLKIFDGGWFPLFLALIMFVLMTTWKRGRRLLSARLIARATPLENFMREIVPTVVARIPGSAIFMTATAKGTPAALIQNSQHNQVIHQIVVVMTIGTEDIPHVLEKDRLSVETLGDGFFRVVAHYGFMEAPNVPALLIQCKSFGLNLDLKTTTFFLGRETLIATDRTDMAIWREKLFAFMAQNAQRATDYFQIPSDRAIEIGTVVEL